ncbi:unnamed protein product [Microthlaspi erraticum]|uniref:Uncharacterized protein n=1 Tax=Microthlaspi erraticum TaxID=1685480 RepID=A0A6D2IXZ4_9BRAS|nr:unnamed protein product [Microthlaspi erraticum]
MVTLSEWMWIKVSHWWRMLLLVMETIQRSMIEVIAQSMMRSTRRRSKTLNDKLDKILTGQQKQGGYYKGYNTNNNTNLSYRSTNVRILKTKCIHLNKTKTKGTTNSLLQARLPPKVFGNQNQGSLKLKQE